MSSPPRQPSESELARMQARAAREIITPDAFTVAPALLGLPLSSPRRRAAAMAIDLAVAGILVKFVGSALAGALAVLVFMRLAQPSRTGGVLRRWMTHGLRIAAVVFTFVFVLNLVGDIGGWFGGDDEVSDAARVEADAERAFDAIDDLLEDPLTHVPTAQEDGDVATDDAVVAGAGNVASDDTVDAVSADVAPDNAVDAGAGDVAIDGVRDAVDQVGNAPLLVVPAAGVRDAIVPIREHAERMEDELEDARAGIGLKRLFTGISDDLGLGFGWFAVYFTAFLVLWNGQTPGKRALRIRVIRLDGKPLSWWIAFERFGGYAASLSIGLLGFLQIMWDRNRQGLHDKAVETVVVRVLPGG